MNFIKSALYKSLKYKKALSLKNIELENLPRNGILHFDIEDSLFAKATVSYEKINSEEDDFFYFQDYPSYDHYCIIEDDVSQSDYSSLLAPKSEFKDVKANLLGYGLELQDAVIYEILDRLKLTDEPLTEIFNYRLLAQFSADIFDKSEDAIISFIIKNSDLKTLDFSNVYYGIQS